ncbi:Na+/H+ antiporter NhaA [Pectinatus sottacetonis]|uniref:Na+/H+ antiporter NhaA n=1 Tax=Pectinatus sottacetonis TaxID=1002795 RepID=UPI0018C6DB96|nr:Na+/H+ antiporter NhaA [Pectinatus sottacetonis]
MKRTIRDMRKRAENLTLPFSKFFKNESSSGLVLLLFAVLAMIIANTIAADKYKYILHMHFTIASFNLSILHWINDGLMAVFFFVVGLEIKREFLFGELKSLSATILPVMGAIGGMIMPAIIYSLVNWGQVTLHGWGIPMATDIAFSLGILSIAGSRAPRSIAVFLTALAIVDDLGAIIVIALFYSSDVSFLYLGYGLAALMMAIILNKVGSKNVLLYLLAGIAAWTTFYKAGVHPTIAGVALGMIIPADKSQNVAKSLLHKLEHMIQPWSSWVIMPVFALANAGVQLNFSGLEELLTPVSVGVILGLVVGKPLGIFGTAFLLFKMKIVKLPEKTSYKHFLGAGALGGIGFTMSLFIASLAFANTAEYINSAKIGIIMASCLSGIVGMCIFKMIKYE